MSTLTRGETRPIPRLMKEKRAERLQMYGWGFKEDTLTRRPASKFYTKKTTLGGRPVLLTGWITSGNTYLDKKHEFREGFVVDIECTIYTPGGSYSSQGLSLDGPKIYATRDSAFKYLQKAMK